MTTALADPVADVGTREAPEPVVCGWCGGEGLEPFEEAGAIPCLACDGVGVQPVEFRLPPSRTHAVRVVSYRPTCGRVGACAGVLAVGVARKATHKLKWDGYQLVETENHWRGRSFVVAKVGRPDRVHHLFFGVDEVTCDCEGREYLSTARANQSALEEGRELYLGYGCVHADSLAALLVGGWFNL